MRVLVTGSAGQVGGALLPLVENQAVVLAPSRQDFDLSRPADLPDRLSALKPDLIINPAAYTVVDRAEDESELAFRINAEAPGAIAEWAARHRVPFLHFSTDYVFDGSGAAPWREDGPTGPLSVYGASKLAGEEAVKSAGGPHLIVRTSWVYAAKGANFLRTIARLAAEREELRIVDDQIGAPTSAHAIAHAVCTILPPGFEDVGAALEKRGGIVNIVCAGETSWYGFAVAIVAGLRSRGANLRVERILPIGSAEFPAKAKRPFNSRLDLTRLRHAFGVSMPSWQQALDRELDLIRELA
ncbi:dTDP-4-dehydrorhamnose reductase [Bradyrhizobium lablabi]|uniref:dTDP-4-dehydrorhamnose reductase n=1 Tax=Bradyrhizobium lablabi TaxID=722472 RepID=UPI001BA61CC8|nr:dTDP-4-dehydrorhamnose reductase [Bradyrhizobium lablabi]MBR0694159.1 dTDP-4-dehydrorhamnose reductase [Bradyrhizobium lablabi]